MNPVIPLLCCCCSVAQLCPTLCDPMDCSTPGFPILHYLSPRVCSNLHPLSWWYHSTISSSVTPFSSCPQSFPASGSFPTSWLFASGGQSIGVSASTTNGFPLNLEQSPIQPFIMAFKASSDPPPHSPAVLYPPPPREFTCSSLVFSTAPGPLHLQTFAPAIFSWLHPSHHSASAQVLAPHWWLLPRQPTPSPSHSLLHYPDIQDFVIKHDLIYVFIHLWSLPNKNVSCTRAGMGSALLDCWFSSIEKKAWHFVGTISPLHTNLQVVNFQRCKHACQPMYANCCRLDFFKELNCKIQFFHFYFLCLFLCIYHLCEKYYKPITISTIQPIVLLWCMRVC